MVGKRPLRWAEEGDVGGGCRVEVAMRRKNVGGRAPGTSLGSASIAELPARLAAEFKQTTREGGL